MVVRVTLRMCIPCVGWDGQESKSMHVSKTILIFMCMLCLEGPFLDAQSQCGDLLQEERIAFREIVAQLGKKDWGSKNPCDATSWSFAQTQLYNTSIICNCSFPNGSANIQNIYFKAQDLAGVLPPSLAKLQYLKEIDLSRNYLSGTIPLEWAAFSRLEYIDVSVNRLSGPIPKYLGNITTLTYLSLETNFFNGSVPSELRKLVNLERLILSENFLMGKLPVELNELKNLTELRISSNNFTGELPNFHNLANLERLEIMASGFKGPIPIISALTKLTELKISNLNGGSSKFPLLEGMKNMSTLVLRSCNISGNIPPYFTNMSGLSTLDLSFNNLEGAIPELAGLRQLEFVYLTGNRLSGSLPDSMKLKDSKLQIDLSYNNLNESSIPSDCRDLTLNLFRSYEGRISSEISKCLPHCPKAWYAFHVNCGGKRVRIGETTFEEDEVPARPVNFIHVKENWGISMTGYFWNRPDNSPNDFIASNISVLTMNDSNLYTSARLSPLSLTYFGRCLANGNYTVTLHFAEIVFRNNRSFHSLGRRLFDVYIQGEQKLKDFDIEHDAGGVDKVSIKLFKNILVRNGGLEIRFHYAGKGTTTVPTNGIYGPLISAISVKSEFKPPLSRRNKIFIASGASLFALLLIVIPILLFCWRKGYLGGRISREQVLRGFDLHTGLYTFKQMQAATNNFDPVNKLGEGGFGSVYKGTLLDGTRIAVKELSSKSKQGSREFVNEIGALSGLQHPNLVKLHGCCVERNHLLLVYEFMENNSLARALFGPEEYQLEMDWPTRHMICLGIANGLVYLHEEATLKIVHRDIKANNILLDKDLNPKISDFGLAKLDEEEKTHITTRVAGTIGYMAPEYALWGYLTYKADVYSFGVVALELVAGKDNMKYRPTDKCVCLLDWALILQKQKRLMELVDPRLKNFDKQEAEKIIRIALLCTSPSPALRPTMSEVVSMLNGNISIRQYNMGPDVHNNELKLQSLREKYHDSYIDKSSSLATTSSYVVCVEGK